MKKLVSLLLVIASLLSLTACGGNSAPTDTTTTPDNSTTAPVVSDNENTSTEPTTETAPEAEPFRFAGTWRLVQKTATPSEKRYIIDEYGNMEYYEFCFCAIGDYHRSFASAADCQKNDDGTYLLKEIDTYEFIGAEKVIGKVYVPKGWNG